MTPTLHMLLCVLCAAVAIAVTVFMSHARRYGLTTSYVANFIILIGMVMVFLVALFGVIFNFTAAVAGTS